MKNQAQWRLASLFFCGPVLWTCSIMSPSAIAQNSPFKDNFIVQVNQNEASQPESLWEDISLGLIASTLAELGETEKALDISQSLNNAQIQTEILIRVVLSHFQKGNTAQVLEILQNIPPSQAQLIANQITTELAEREEWEQSEAWVKSLPEDVQNGLLEKLVRLFAHAEERDRALTLYQSLSNPPDELTFFLASMFAQNGQISQAIAMAEKLEGNDFKAASLAEIAQHETQAEKQEELFAQALALAETLDPTVKPNVFGEIAFRLGQTGDFDQAFAIAETLNPQSRREVQYQLTLSLAEKGQLDRAIKTTRLLETPTNANPTHPDLYTIAVEKIAIIATEQGEIEQALQLAEREKTRRQIIITLAKTGNTETALSLFNDLSYPLQFQTLPSLMSYLSKSENERLMTPLLSRLTPEDSELILLLAEQSTRAGLLDTAIALSEQLEDPSQKEELLYLMIAILSEQGNYQNAIALLPEITENQLKITAFSLLSYQLSQNNHPLLNSLLEQAKTLSNPYQKAVIYSTAALQYALTEKPQQAQEFLDKALSFMR